MSSDTSSSSELVPSNVKPRRKAVPPGSAVKHPKKRVPAKPDNSEDESDECTDSELGDSSSLNESSDDVNAEGSSVVYLDYNATTPLDREVLSSIHRALRSAWGNPSSAYQAGIKAKTVITESRQSIASMIGAASDEIVFMSGGTEANNLVLNTAVEQFRLSRPCRETRPHIISTTLEHDSIKLVLENFQKLGKADVTFVDAVKGSGRVIPDDLIAAIQPSTCLISVMLANNETGIIQPLGEISSRLHEHCANASCAPILLHTDAAQAIGKIAINVDKLGVDYLTIVGHKFYGPRIGALYVRQLGRQQTPLHPMFFGGGQERNYRPGTENTGMIAGLGKACDVVSRNIDRYQNHMMTVRDYLELKLTESFPDSVHFNGRVEDIPRLPNTCNVSFVGSQLKGYRVLSAVKRLQASIGAACHSQFTDRPSPVLLSSGISEDRAANAIRLSIGRGTTIRDIDIVVDDLKRAVAELRDETPGNTGSTITK